jgi:periplasmic mercuric ion binding protein
MKLKTLIVLAALWAPGAMAATIELTVNGLVCGFCAQGIEKTLRGKPATADVFVSLENRLVAVATKEGMELSDAELRAALTDAGYEVKAIARTDTPIAELRSKLKARE